MKVFAPLRFSPYVQLAVFLISILIVLWSLIGYDLHRIHKQALSASGIATQNLSRAFAEEVKASVNSIDLSLIDLRDRWLDSQVDFAGAVQRRQSHLAQDVGFQVAIINADGILEFSSSDPQAKGLNLSDREHFRVHRNESHDRLFISKPVLGRVTNRWSVQFTRPIINAKGFFEGVIVMSVAPEYFSRFFNTINLGKDGAIALIRTSGEILARSPNPDQNIGKTIGRQAVFATPGIDHGLYRIVSEIDGIERTFAWRNLVNAQLTVIVGQSVNTVLAPFYKQRRIYVLAGLGLTFLLALIGYVLLSNLRERAEHAAALEQNAEALKESIKQVQEEQARIKVIIENSHDAFVGIDADGVITDWNRKAETTFGWPSHEAIGRVLTELIVPEEHRAAHNAGYARYVSSGRGSLIDTVIEVEALARSGRRIPVEIALAGYHNGSEYVSNAFIRDISERKEAQRLDQERLRVLEETRKALQQAQKLEALGRLTGGIAHDFNNVLQTLTTGIDVAFLSSKDERIKSALQASKRAVQRGVELTRQLLVFGRVQEAHLRTVNLTSQIDGMIPLLQGALPSNIRLDIAVDKSVWAVEIDPLQFELALLNLAMNARDAMPTGGVFSIQAQNECIPLATSELESGDYVSLRIADTGEGMGPDVLAKALDPFFTTKAVGKGSGMGLSQVYGFVKHMRGTLSLRSEKGKGLEVSIYLPRSKNIVALFETDTAEIAPSTVTGISILFVEDDPLIRETVQPALQAQGFEVTVAENGDAALKVLESGHRIHVVFSDIVMPGEVGGMELAEIVQKRFPQTKIVLATGYSGRPLSLPNVRMIGKPYQVGEVMEILSRVAKEAAGPYTASA